MSNPDTQKAQLQTTATIASNGTAVGAVVSAIAIIIAQVTIMIAPPVGTPQTMDTYFNVAVWALGIAAFALICTCLSIGVNVAADRSFARMNKPAPPC